MRESDAEGPMERHLRKFSDEAYALLRIVSGLLLACHGAQKLFGVLHSPGEPQSPVQLLSLMGLAGVIEFLGGLLIAIGLASDYAAFVASGQMAVAYFMVHFPQSFWPIRNRGELAVVFCFLFLYVATHGPGKWSVSELLRR